MSRREQPVSFEEKNHIRELVREKHSDAEIATAIGRPLSTVRKWRRRFQEQGKAGFLSTHGRPARGALSSYPPDLREKILRLRKAHPGWGPMTLLVELRRDPYWGQQSLPSRARIAAFLQQEGLTRPYHKRTELPQPARQTPVRPHQVWQMDAQAGLKLAGLGRTSVIHIIDVASRLKIESSPRRFCRKPNTIDYYLALRRAFLHFGLPEQLTLDHDAVFYDNTRASPYPTRIHLWLIALGLEVSFIRKRRPTDHAQIERSHQTMHGLTIRGQHWSSEEALWMGLDQRREVYNHYMPIKALDDRSPLEAFPEASFSGRPYDPQEEEHLLSQERVHAFLAQGRWFRKYNDSGIWLGAQYYYVGRGLGPQSVEITFDAPRAAFRLQLEKSGHSVFHPPKGLSKAELMGDLAGFLKLPAYQLALPFTGRDRQKASLSQFLGDTN